MKKRKMLFSGILVFLIFSASAFAQIIVSEKIKKRYYPDGTLKSEHTYKKGMLNGVTRIYREDGSLEREISYQNGFPHGVAKEYYEDGNVFSVKIFKKGKLDGILKEYYPEGSIKKEVSYKTGRLDGVQRIYFENGKVQSVQNYKDGLKEGQSLLYNKNGGLIKEETFHKGRRDGIAKQYDPSGRFFVKTIYRQGERQGTPVRYDKNGNSLVEVSFVEMLSAPVDILSVAYSDDKGTIGISLIDSAGDILRFCLEPVHLKPLEGSDHRWEATSEPRDLFLAAFHPSEESARRLSLGSKEEKAILKILEEGVKRYQQIKQAGASKNKDIQLKLIEEVIEELKHREP